MKAQGKSVTRLYEIADGVKAIGLTLAERGKEVDTGFGHNLILLAETIAVEAGKVEGAAGSA